MLDKNFINKTYIVLSFILFFSTLKLYNHFAANKEFTIEEILHSFLMVIAFTIIYVLVLLLINEYTTSIILRAIIVTGICLRLSYTLFTDSGTRTYDVYRESWGHIDYIKYIAQNFSLPPVNECQTYHPPVHHIISALALNLSKLLNLKEAFQLKFVQLVMVMISSLALIIFYKILKELNCNTAVTITGIALFAFHPENIYFSSRINNDNTLLFFYTVGLYFLIRWLNSHSIKNMVLLSLSSALAALTKFSGFMLAPLIAVAFISILIKKSRNIQPYLRQYFIFLVIYLPLSTSYYIRNYILFKQEFAFVPSLGKGFTPTFYNLVHIPFSKMAEYPFNIGGLRGGEFFVEFFLKSSLFGEWQYPGLECLASAMLILAIILAVVILLYAFLPNKYLSVHFKYVLILNLILPVLLEIKLRTDLPIACSQDFRYAAPVLISAAFFLGQAISRLKHSRLGFLRYPIISSVAVFCILSSIFMLSLGYYR